MPVIVRYVDLKAGWSVCSLEIQKRVGQILTSIEPVHYAAQPKPRLTLENTITQMISMKVGILGSGQVGQALGNGFASKGHDVKLGSRTPDKQELRDWLKATKGKVGVATFAEASSHGEVLVFCPLGEAAENVIKLAGEKNFDGKLVLDATNPLDFSKGMPPGLFVGTTDSLGERVQRWLPKAKVVKCFNIVNNQTMINPRMKEGMPTMIICGNDENAKRQTAAILNEFGWDEPIDIGGIDGARWLEAYTALWVRLSVKLGSWTIAARILRQ
jgi:predicted dinucleotide-binding enzyme